jgi:phospholipase D1/2
MPTPTPLIEAAAFTDPLRDELWKDQWVATAVHNTEIFRKVFRCVPDDLVTSWASYKAFTSHAEKFNKVPANVADPEHEPVKTVHGGSGGPHGSGGGGSGGGAVGQQGLSASETETASGDVVNGKPRDISMHEEGGRGHSGTTEGSSEGDDKSKNRNRQGSAPGSAWHDWELEEMEELLQEVRGHLGMSHLASPLDRD